MTTTTHNLQLPRLPFHTHRLLIVLWAEGHPIEFLTPEDGWVHLPSPGWLSNATYRARLENSHIISSPNGVSFEPLSQQL